MNCVPYSHTQMCWRRRHAMQSGEMQIVSCTHGNEWIWPLDPVKPLPDVGLVWNVCPWCFGDLPPFKRLTPLDWLRLWRAIQRTDGEGEE
jgi:hypothetical protein